MLGVSFVNFNSKYHCRTNEQLNIIRQCGYKSNYHQTKRILNNITQTVKIVYMKIVIFLFIEAANLSSVYNAI